MNAHIQSEIILSRTAGIRPGQRMVVAVLLAVMGWFGLPVFTVTAASEVYKEYEVKAVFLFNFAQFVEWPQEAFPEAATPLCIGVLGDDAFTGILEGMVKGERVKGRALVIKRLRDMADVTTCHVLFVSRSEESRLSKIFSLLNNAGVLTVGECKDFAAREGVINFFLHENKIRFEINPEAARRKGLKISSQLLSLARIIETDPTKERR